MNNISQPPNRLASLAWPGVFLFTTLIYTFLYAFIHESGHALVGIVFGQKLVSFKVNIFTLDAYVSMQGDLTHLQRTIQSASGHGLPLMLWSVLMLLVPRRGEVVLRLLKAISSASMLASSSVWMIIPMLYLRDQAPAGDDVTWVLDVSGMPPLLLAGLAGLVIVLAAVLASYKNQGLLSDVRRFSELRRQGILDQQMLQALPRSRATLLALSASGAVFSLLLVGLQIVLPGKEAVGQIPPGYTLVASVELSQGGSTANELAQFTLADPGRAGVFVLIREINSPLFELVLIGDGGFREILIRGEGYSATLHSVGYDEAVQPGTYRLLVTHRASPGQVDVYLRER